MRILSWNIQYAKGVDNFIDVGRIAADIKAQAEVDIICLQEVLVKPDADQVKLLSQHFPSHTVVFGAAIDRASAHGRLKFGNLILCQVPVIQVLHHKLPQPPEPVARHMPRQAIEIIVPYQNTLLRVVTTHLEYFAQKQRSEQVKYLVNHHNSCMQRFREPSPQGGEDQFESLPETRMSVYCGDFNLPVESDDYSVLTDKNNEFVPSASDALHDCWSLLHADTPHTPTCGIYDHEQWQEGAHCRDFFFASDAAASHVSAVDVDTTTAASDHQPLVLTLS